MKRNARLEEIKYGVILFGFVAVQLGLFKVKEKPD